VEIQEIHGLVQKKICGQELEEDLHLEKNQKM